MKALVYHGPGQRAWEAVPDPHVQDASDVIVKVTTSTICGTDLHILKGDVPAVTDGTILGHEARRHRRREGRRGVDDVDVGDRVLVSCITACGRCRYCKEAHYGLCPGGGGWILGHLIDGVQAEYARVPFADTSVYKVPDGLTDEQVLSSPTSSRPPTRSACSTGACAARRHRRDRRRRPDRAGGDHDREAATRPGRSSPSTSPTAGSHGRPSSAPT